MFTLNRNCQNQGLQDLKMNNCDDLTYKINGCAENI